MLQKQEVHHNSPVQVEEYLRQALDTVEAIDPPEDLRGIMFAKAADLAAAKTVTLEQISAGGILQHNARH